MRPSILHHVLPREELYEGVLPRVRVHAQQVKPYTTHEIIQVQDDIKTHTQRTRL